MRKTALLMGLGCSSLFAGVLWFLYARKEEHADLVKRFMVSKRNLRQCAETINSTNQNRPAEIVYAADHSFVEALDEALRYMDTAPKHMLRHKIATMMDNHFLIKCTPIKVFPTEVGLIIF